MDSLTLLTFAGDIKALKVQVVAAYNSFNLKVENVQDTNGPAVAGAPAGKFPVLKTPSGIIFESNAAARYLARFRPDAQLLGQNFFDEAQVGAWLDFAANDVEIPVAAWIYQITGVSKVDAGAQKKAEASLKTALATLEAHLLNNTYLVGDNVTLADIAVAAALFQAFKYVLDEAARKTIPSVTRWFFTVANQPNFVKVAGEVTFATEVVKSAAAPKVEKAAAPKAEKAAAPKAEKPKKEENNDDDDMPKEPKKADPFAALPPAKMNLDEWKRTYSNSRAVKYYPSMEWLWEHMSPEDYSIYHCRFNHNDENTVDWKTSNMAGGMLQRMDFGRKTIFGSLAVCPDANGKQFNVSGVFLTRGGTAGGGDKIALDLIMSENVDAELYTWTKLDTTDPKVRELIGHYWCAEDTLGSADLKSLGPIAHDAGAVLYDSKLFK